MKKICGILLIALCAQTVSAQWNSDPAINLQVYDAVVSDMQAVRTNDGKTWVAFYKQVNGGYQMYAQLLDTAGNKLLGTNGVAVDTLPSGTATFVFNICTDGKGNLVIGLQDQRTGSNMTTVGYAINQTGQSLWNGDTGVVLGSGYSPYPVALASGEVLFAWSANSGGIDMQKVTATGALAWTSPVNYATSSGNVTRGQLVAMSDTGYVMVYQSYFFGISSTLYAQRFDSNGVTQWSNPVQLCNETTSAARYYSISQEADTTYLGYFSSSSANHFNSWLQRINPDGTLPYGINGAAFSDYSSGAEPNEMATHIAIETDSPYVWAVSSFTNSSQSQYGVYVQKFKKSDGTRMLNADGKEVYPISATRWAQQGGLALKNGGPAFMVVNDQNYHIKGTVLTSSGDTALSPMDVDLSTTSATMADPKGRFAFTDNVANFCVALWTEDRAGAGNHVYAQRFSLSMLDTNTNVTVDTTITVATEDSVPAEITTDGGTLNLIASINPSSVSQDVTWTIIDETGDATISTAGVVTAVADGTVWAKATSVAAPTYSDSLEITISNQSTGIQDVNNLPGFKLYPNPVHDVLHIQLKAHHPALLLKIVDLNGRVVYSKNIPANSLQEPLSMNLTNISDGMYLLQLLGKGIKIEQKFTKK